LAQTTRPIDNPYNLPVFAYANEVMPAYFDGIGTDTLYVVDTKGRRWPLSPRPHYDYKTAKLSEERIAVLRHQHEILNKAREIVPAKGLDAYLEFLDSEPSVVSYERISPYELKITFDDGESEYMTIPFVISKKHTLTRIESHEREMSTLQTALDKGRVPWFGSGYYTEIRGTPEKLRMVREALHNVRSGKPLTPKQLSETPLFNKSTRLDALRKYRR